MAASKSTALVVGATKYEKPTSQANPSLLVLTDTAGNHWYVWVNTSGELDIGDAETVEAAGFNFNTGGTKVGGQ